MNISLQPGCYVVAVSGGVDSMVLLDLLHKQPQLRLVVAHFDHGIRQESAEDRALAQQTAQQLGLPFVYDEGRLGADASEAAARKARYEFLHAVRVGSNADAIVTAHHQDDMLETAIINMVRGTGRRGLSSLDSRDRVLRPLLKYSKKQIREYATDQGLTWHEDKTNQDEKYLRNYVRKNILNKLSISEQQDLLRHIETAKTLNEEIDSLLATQLHIQSKQNQIDRRWFVQLPHNVAAEVMAAWLRQNDLPFNRRRIHDLVVAAKTYTPGKRADITKNVQMRVSARMLALEGLDR